jgi:hypothetical protein
MAPARQNVSLRGVQFFDIAVDLPFHAVLNLQETQGGKL